MRTADAFGCGTFEEVGIVSTPYARPGALVNSIVDIAAAQIGKAEQAGGICVIHEELISVAIDFICPDNRRKAS